MKSVFESKFGFAFGVALVSIVSVASLGCGSDTKARNGRPELGKIPLDLNSLYGSTTAPGETPDVPANTRLFFEDFVADPATWFTDTSGSDSYIKFANGLMKLGVSGDSTGTRNAYASLEINLLAGQKLPEKARIRIRFRGLAIGTGMSAQAAFVYGGTNQKVWDPGEFEARAQANQYDSSPLEFVYDTTAAPTTSSMLIVFQIESPLEGNEAYFGVDEIEITSL